MSRTPKKSPKKVETPRIYVKDFEAKNETQRDYIRSIYENDITICSGCAGTGKSFLSTAIGISLLAQGLVERIVITRPVLEAGRSLGALPGYADEKVEPYMRPVLEACRKLVGYSQLAVWKNEKKIEVVPLELMRGMTLEGYIILDEAQNCTREQLRMFITRIGEGAKMVVNGDMTQSDLPQAFKDNFHEFIKRMDTLPGVGMIHMTEADIVRHRLIGPILNRLKDF